ncbi:MAG: hypothetical protein JWM18_2177 [Chloroflexi bacterium]|nr:hypothetical protein [Chloroflexota bacterium]
MTDPVTPCAGQPFQAKWAEINAGSAPSEPYDDTMEMNSLDSTDQQSITNSDAVNPGDPPTERSVTFTMPAGTYNMNLTIDGTSMYLGDVIIEDC